VSIFGDRLFAEIEALYFARLDYFVQVARAITGDRDRASDAVQDAFASVIRSRGTFRGEGSLEAFVWRAVVNAARKATRRPLVEVHELDELSEELPLPRADVAPQIAALPERQRLAVFLRYYADLDYQTIADTLGIEVGTVGATLAAAHRMLRKSIEQEVKR
jgi:RNA polymerase sigma factor (sigma-70 family)